MAPGRERASLDGMARIVLARGMDGKVAPGRACQPFARMLHLAVGTWEFALNADEADSMFHHFVDLHC